MKGLVVMAERLSEPKKTTMLLAPLVLTLFSMVQLIGCATGIQFPNGGWTHFFVGALDGTWYQPLLSLYFADWLSAVFCAYFACWVAQRARHDLHPFIKALGIVALFLLMRALIGMAEIQLIIMSGGAQLVAWCLISALMAVGSVLMGTALWRQEG